MTTSPKDALELAKTMVAYQIDPYGELLDANDIRLVLSRALISAHEKLEKATSALKFYAKEKNWQSMELEDCNDDYEHITPKKPRLITGGKRAREALKEIEG